MEASGYEPGFGVPDDRILTEVSHELGNYFHKLHYWIDFVKSEIASTAEEGDQAGLDMLEDTTERLEAFLRMTLEYFTPPRLSFDRIRVDDLVGGIRKRLKGRSLEAKGLDEHAQTEVMIDVSRMTHVVRTVVDRISATLVEGNALTLKLARSTRGEFDGLELEFFAGDARVNGATLTSGIEMAVAEKFVQVHGGELFERGGDHRSLVMFLPLYK